MELTFMSILLHFRVKKLNNEQKIKALFYL